MNLEYPLKWWFTSIILAPIYMVVYSIISKSNYLISPESISIIFIFILFGLVLSLPMQILCIILFKFLIKKINSEIIIKLILNIVCITGIFTTFKLIGGSASLDLSLAYSTSVILSSLIYKIRSKEVLTLEKLDDIS